MQQVNRGRHVTQQLGETYRAMMAAFAARVGHPLPRWRILLALHEQGQCSQKDLADRCRLDPASLTRQLQAMEAQEWISRQTDAEDNRRTNVTLTARGKRVVNDAMPLRAAFFDEALNGLSATQVKVFSEVLLILEANVRTAQQAERTEP